MFRRGMNRIQVKHEFVIGGFPLGGTPVAKRWADGVTASYLDESKTMIDRLLEEQRSLSVVARFAQRHEQARGSLHQGQYRDLIPLSQPQPGEQYAFEVDLDRCTGCKACVAACHSLNGLENDESWRAVGLLVTGEPAAPLQQTVTTACHHCVDPGCLNGCPVLAYEKDPVTGIVKHLDDQCIGCQYCILKCPYEVPRYSARLGIVRKCDLCSNRLAVGEAPACAQACPTSAIRITVVSAEAVRGNYASAHSATETANSFLPDSPDPAYTLPTTRYRSSKGLPEGLRAADREKLQPASPHWPLVWMLVLTQAGIGGILFAAFEFATLLFAAGPAGTASLRGGHILASVGLLGAGLGASILHLGRPLQAWRAFLGVRRSWLSREILAFGALAAAASILTAAGVWPGFGTGNWLGAALAVTSWAGLAALLCSIMVYVDTPRRFWSAARTVPRFAGTTVLLGLALGAVFAVEQTWVCAALSIVAMAKLGAELAVLRHLSEPADPALRRTAILQIRELRGLTLFRAGCLLAGGVILAQYALARGEPLSPAFTLTLFALLFAGEVAERSLFFRSVAQPIMPGGLP